MNLFHKTTSDRLLQTLFHYMLTNSMINVVFFSLFKWHEILMPRTDLYTGIRARYYQIAVGRSNSILMLFSNQNIMVM